MAGPSIVQMVMGNVLQEAEPEKSKPNHPFVELLDDGWRVSVAKRCSEGYVDHFEKVLHVPIDSNPTSERTRFHELGHVKWTPGDVNPGQLAKELDIPQAFLNAFEDARINEKLALADPELEKVLRKGRLKCNHSESKQLIQKVREVPDPKMQQELKEAAAAMYVCSSRYGERPKLKDLALRAGVPIPAVDAIVRTVTSPDASFEDTMAAAVALKELLREPDGLEQPQVQPQPDPDGQPMEGGDKPMEMDGMNEAVDQMMEKIATKPSPLDHKPEQYDFLKQEGKGVGGDEEEKAIDKIGKSKSWGIPKMWVSSPPSAADVTVTPGVMQIVRPRLDVRIVRKLGRPRVPKNDLAGGEIRGLHRLVLDEKILRRKAPLRTRKKVGTMLIDASGSMQIAVSDIDLILTEAPQVTVAVYAANARSKTLDKTRELRLNQIGHLAIVAHRGKRITGDAIKPWLGGGNVVDTEALRWLASQPGPRIWICDGIVTGMGDQSSANIIKECGQIATRARVKRFHSIDAFVMSTRLKSNEFDIADSETGGVGYEDSIDRDTGELYEEDEYEEDVEF